MWIHSLVVARFSEHLRAHFLSFSAPERQFELKASPVMAGGWTNVTCRATEVYPEPRLLLFGDTDRSTGARKALAGVTVLTQARPADYDISAWAMVRAGDPLNSGTATVTCVLKVPEANHSRFQTLDLLSGTKMARHVPSKFCSTFLVCSKFSSWRRVSTAYLMYRRQAEGNSSQTRHRARSLSRGYRIKQNQGRRAFAGPRAPKGARGWWVCFFLRYCTVPVHSDVHKWWTKQNQVTFL